MAFFIFNLDPVNPLHPLHISMYILHTVLYTFLKVLFWTCHSFVTEYPTVIIKDLQFELSSKTDEHIVMMFMCAKSKSSCQQHTCTPVVRWEFLWVLLQRFKCVRDCQLGGGGFEAWTYVMLKNQIMRVKGKISHWFFKGFVFIVAQ